MTCHITVNPRKARALTRWNALTGRWLGARREQGERNANMFWPEIPVTKWGPQTIAKLVNITPILLGLINQLITDGGPHCTSQLKPILNLCKYTSIYNHLKQFITVVPALTASV